MAIFTTERQDAPELAAKLALSNPPAYTTFQKVLPLAAVREKAAVARAEAAEKALNEKKQATISAALTPRAEKKPVPTNPGTAWREAVAACGGNIVTAAQKHPELYAAISKH